MLSADCFANILDLDQARQNVGPDLDTNCFDTNGIPKRNLKKNDFERNQLTTKSKLIKNDTNLQNVKNHISLCVQTSTTLRRLVEMIL